VIPVPQGPLLWYLNRSTGMVLLLLLTATVLMGIWSTRKEAGGRLPRFAVQALHRNLGLLSVTMVTLHIGSAVLDEYVDIRWWQAFVPYQLHYQPLWLALGIVAFDLMLAVVLTSLVRARLGHRAWRAVHLSSYVIWALAVAHGVGIGTDTATPWGRWTYIGSAAAVAASAAVRILEPRRRAQLSPQPSESPAAA
jgi:DMSO/TMAO reductase YedYZ heme-binding membrane subunit